MLPSASSEIHWSIFYVVKNFLSAPFTLLLWPRAALRTNNPKDYVKTWKHPLPLLVAVLPDPCGFPLFPEDSSSWLVILPLTTLNLIFGNFKVYIDNSSSALASQFLDLLLHQRSYITATHSQGHTLGLIIIIISICNPVYNLICSYLWSIPLIFPAHSLWYPMSTALELLEDREWSNKLWSAQKSTTLTRIDNLGSCSSPVCILLA